jgi:deoxycytidylate deaminase
VLLDATGDVLGEGYNHNVFFNGKSKSKGKSKTVLHAECHALATVLAGHGEETAFAAFATATAYIVELDADGIGFGNAPPCPKCMALLRGVGIRSVVHSNAAGPVVLALPPQNERLLEVEIAFAPFMVACEQQGVRCQRIERLLTGCGKI